MKVLYGSSAKNVGSETIWTKQCQCKATASGPRLVIGRFDDSTGTVFRAGMADLACDECDTPWKKTANGEGAGDE